MDLISRGIYPESLGTDKARKTDYSCSHWGRVRWRLPRSFWMLCSNKSDFVQLQWKLGKGRVAGSAESSYSAGPQSWECCPQAGETMQPLSLPLTVIHWLWFVRLRSYWPGLLTKKNSCLSFSGCSVCFTFYFQTLPGKMLLHAFSAPSLSIQMIGFYWARDGLEPSGLAV